MRSTLRTVSRYFPTALGLVITLAACDHYAAAGVSAAPSLTPAPPARTEQAPTDPCAPAAPAPIEVDPVRRVDGTCDPDGLGFVYRCAPTLPMVAVIKQDGTTRRFLGGDYAVPVSLPPTAFPIGSTAFGALYRDPAEPRLLWLEADGHVHRLLALPNEQQVPDAPTAFLIGDSILDGGDAEVLGGLPGWITTVDAEVGRDSWGAAPIAEALLETPDVLVIEIGVNDHEPTSVATNLSRILVARGDARLIVWATAHGPDEDIPAVNEAIVAGMGAIGNGAILDWDRLVPPEALSSDGVHPDTGQQGAFASLLDPFLLTWLEAVRGAGPTGCARTVRAGVEH